jgi:heat shock protein HtpX
MSSQVKTALLLASLTALILLIGHALGGNKGIVLAFFLALVMNLVSYWYSDKIVLKMYRARPVTRDDDPYLYNTVRNLAMRAGIPEPKLYLIPQKSPNAFATGRNPANAAVAVTEGALELLDRHELEGVLAHELAHVRNRDILVSTIAATLAGAIMMIGTWLRWAAIFGGFQGDDDDGAGGLGLLAIAILAPVAAIIIQLAISRSREYLADATGARIAGTPRGLASALEKLHGYSRRAPMRNANPSTAHMFIVQPFSGGGLTALFSTHPPVEKRIQKLLGMYR